MRTVDATPVSNYLAGAGSTLSQVGTQFEHMTQDLLCQVMPAGVLHFASSTTAHGERLAFSYSSKARP